MAMRVSVVIRAKNESLNLTKLFPRLKEQQADFQWEIVLVDSGSTDNTIELSQSYGARIVHLAPSLFTWGRSLNVGARAAVGDLIVNLNADALPADSLWLKYLVDGMRDPLVAGVCGRQVPILGLNPFEERELMVAFPAAHRSTVRTRIRAMEIGVDKYLFSSGSHILRKSVWEQIPFDEDIPHGEDRLWVREVVARGYRVEYEPKSVVIHSHPYQPKSNVKRAFTAGYGAKQVYGKECQLDSRLFTIRTTRDAIIDDWFYCFRSRKFLYMVRSPLFRMRYHRALMRGARACVADHKA